MFNDTTVTGSTPLPTVLLIDDENDFRKGLAQQLEVRDFHILDTDNGEDAIKIVRHDNPQVVILAALIIAGGLIIAFFGGMLADRLLGQRRPIYIGGVLMQEIVKRRLAREVGISPAYLNLIEHNRRRIGGKLLVNLARALDTEPVTLSEGAETALVDVLREAAVEGRSVERPPWWHPILRLERYLTGKGLLDSDHIEAIRAETLSAARRAFEQAEATPDPSLEDGFRFMYAEMPEPLGRQLRRRRSLAAVEGAHGGGAGGDPGRGAGAGVASKPGVRSGIDGEPSRPGSVPIHSSDGETALAGRRHGR